MWLVLVGIALAGLKLAGVSPVAGWPWWAALSPFAAAAVWWWLADVTGMTKKAQDRKIQKKVDERRRRQMEALGMKDSTKGARGEAFAGPLTKAPSTLVPDALKRKDPPGS